MIIRDLAVDINNVGGTVTIINGKTATVLFLDAQGNQVYFTKAPRISFTMLSASVTNPYKVKNTKSGNLFIGFIIGFQNSGNYVMEWTAVERG